MECTCTMSECRLVSVCRLCVCVCACARVSDYDYYNYTTKFCPVQSSQANERTVFSVRPPSAQLHPKQSLELTVTAYIDDPIRISDKLTIVVSRGVNFTISLRAEGKGTTIVSDPPIQPSIHLGTFFSRGPCESKITLTNRGHRSHALSWSTEGFSASKMKRAEMNRKSQDLRDIKQRNLFLAEEKAQTMIMKPTFQIVPDKMVLEPLQSRVVRLLGSSEKYVHTHACT